MLCFENKELKVKLSKGLPGKDEISAIVLEENEVENFKVQNKLILQKSIVSSEKEIGYLFLGKKLTSEKYSDDDLKFINTIIQIGSTAIGNSLNFEKLATVNKNS